MTTPDHPTVAALLHAAKPRVPDSSDAELLLADTLGCGRATLLAHPERPVDDASAAEFSRRIARRAAGEPFAYIVGRREFWSLELAVDPAVLIPRPDTETLVERVLALDLPRDARVVDLGTGSGALALAIAHERPSWQVLATDVSATALAVAGANATRLGLGRVEFLEGDWFAPLGDRRCHAIVSNPPYIAQGDPHLATPELRHEPRSALVAGIDGLDAIRAIAAEAPEHLEPGGWLLLEHGAGQADAVRALLVARGFAHVRSLPDLAGLDRVVEARIP